MPIGFLLAYDRNVGPIFYLNPDGPTELYTCIRIGYRYADMRNLCYDFEMKDWTNNYGDYYQGLNTEFELGYIFKRIKFAFSIGGFPVPNPAPEKYLTFSIGKIF